MNLDDDGYVIQCDVCGQVRDYNCQRGNNYAWGCHCKGCTDAQEDWNVRQEVWSLFLTNEQGHHLNYQRALPPEFPNDLCGECAVKMTPIVQRFCDITMVRIFNGRLERAINGKRKENRPTGNNGPTENDVSQCCESSNAGAA